MDSNCKKGSRKGAEKELNLHARTLGTTINETVQTAGVESILAIIYTVANGKDRVYFGPAAR